MTVLVAHRWSAAAAVLAAAFGLAARAEALTGPALVKVLPQGGYVVVMRHASSPMAPPPADQADPGNPRGERQLDEAGKREAAAIGAAIGALHIRIGAVWSSPTYRALETVRLAGLPRPMTAPELGDRGVSMQAASGDQASWLRAKADEVPKAGTDTFIVTHFPNITAAFGDEAKGLADGEALVFRPGPDGPMLVGRIKIDDWAGR